MHTRYARYGANTWRGAGEFFFGRNGTEQPRNIPRMFNWRNVTPSSSGERVILSLGASKVASSPGHSYLRYMLLLYSGLAQARPELLSMVMVSLLLVKHVIWHRQTVVSLVYNQIRGCVQLSIDTS